jgi:mannobiose 2-epimerase
MMAESTQKLKELSEAMIHELQGHILPYWSQRVMDKESGGFIGRIRGDEVVEPNAPRGSILNSRILWTFSAAYNQFVEPSYLAIAKHEFDYIEKYFWDHSNGGVAWMLSGDGKILDQKKHIYAQAFAIYAYSEYFKACSDPLSLKRAVELFELIDQHAYNPSDKAYHEAFSEQWKPLLDVRLSEKDAPVLRSTNTHLHILEAYASLYRVWPDKRLAIRLAELIDVFLDIIFDPNYGHFHSFFDEKWISQSTVYSYGHDIETAWLLLDASETLTSYQRHDQVLELLHIVAQKIIEEGVEASGNGLYNFGSKGQVVDSDRHWWAQAEAIVGLLYAWCDKPESMYLSAAFDLWNYTNSTIIDHQHGEWFFRVNDEGKPYLQEDKVGPWKCPYHTSRACLIVNQLLNNQTTASKTTQVYQV